METDRNQVQELLCRFKNEREKRGITSTQIEQALNIGPGWVDMIETGQTEIDLNILFALFNVTGIDFSSLLEEPLDNIASNISRCIIAIQTGNGITINFRYSNYDAQYFINNASTEQFENLLSNLRTWLASDHDTAKTEAVVTTYQQAVQTWPHANPSDLWWFLVYRAFVDPYNYPASFHRATFEQSWKRTGGWALEVIMVRHYAPGLQKKGIRMFIATTDERVKLLSQATHIQDRLEADKADILLSTQHSGKEVFLGVIHVKASFAERRTDDVPMSKALVEGGFISPLLTLDCKSVPGPHPVNKGELGDPAGKRITAKRKDIEDDGFFSACFSYNMNTIPTPADKAAKARIYSCDFNNPESDHFHHFICKKTDEFLCKT